MKEVHKSCRVELSVSHQPRCIDRAGTKLSIETREAVLSRLGTASADVELERLERVAACCVKVALAVLPLVMVVWLLSSYAAPTTIVSPLMATLSPKKSYS